MYFCSHCGSQNTKEIATGNGGDIYVGESFDDGEEAFDGTIVLIECDDCSKWTYSSQ